MSIINSRIQVLDPQSQTDFLDRVIVGQKLGIAYTATASTAYPITFSEGLPMNYQVIVTLSSTSSGGPPFVTAKTSTGFTVTIPGTPTAGVMDILVIAA